MEETYNTQAIVLNRAPFREDDTKVVLFSADRGKLELVARGTKKLLSKLAAHLEPFNAVKLMVIKGKQYDYIGAAVSEKCFLNIKNDLERLFFAGKAIRVFNKLILKEEKSDASNLFGLLQEFLSLLNGGWLLVNSYQLFESFFALKLLIGLGYKPELYYCVACKNKILPAGNRFNALLGGLTCADCSQTNQAMMISENCIKALRLATTQDLKELVKVKLDEENTREVVKIIESLLAYYQN